MAQSNLLTHLLTVQFSKQAQTLFKTVQLSIPLVQRRRVGWLIGLLLLFITSSNFALTLAVSKPAVAAAATSLQVDAPTSLDPGPEPSKYRLFLPIVKRT